MWFRAAEPEPDCTALRQQRLALPSTAHTTQHSGFLGPFALHSVQHGARRPSAGRYLLLTCTYSGHATGCFSRHVLGDIGATRVFRYEVAWFGSVKELTSLSSPREVYQDGASSA